MLSLGNQDFYDAQARPAKKQKELQVNSELIASVIQIEQIDQILQNSLNLD